MQNNDKKMYTKVCCTCKVVFLLISKRKVGCTCKVVFFFIIRSSVVVFTVLFVFILSLVLLDFIFSLRKLFILHVKTASLLALAKSIYYLGIARFTVWNTIPYLCSNSWKEVFHIVRSRVLKVDIASRTKQCIMMMYFYEE